MRNEADCVTGIFGILEHLKTKIVHILGKIDKILIFISESRINGIFFYINMFDFEIDHCSV